jgi:hypothetical protein
LPDQIECVYLIGCEANTLVKIGRSVDVQERLAALRTMSPVPLTLLWQTLGGAELETALHGHFGSRRAHGEWFDFPAGDAVACVVQALPEIAEVMQRAQRKLAARQAQTAKVSVEQAIVKLSNRERAREALKVNPSMNAGQLARALGLKPAGSIRTMRGELLTELVEASEIPSVRSVNEEGSSLMVDDDTAVALQGLAAIEAGEPTVPWGDVKARLDLDDEPTT